MTARRPLRPDTPSFQLMIEDTQVVGVVVHYQYAFAGNNVESCYGMRVCGRGRLRTPNRQSEGRAPARFALDHDLPAHQLDEALTNREAQAGPAILARGRRIDLAEGLK